MDLRTALRRGGSAGLRAAIAEALRIKPPRHGFSLDGSGGPAKAMISIGG
ncbi:MAG: hypothetical protein D6705_05170 [Deltaproteobacteria bacterium]|nr:MAG: hypothetical protein D6705_05170 [Deltaproteobacteria bacterium]